jgi:hypothetical protein
MPTYLVDASALCKRYFVNEIGAEIVDDLFNDGTSSRYILNLAIAEVLNAFYRVHREGHLSEPERDALIAAFYDDIASGVLLVYSLRDKHIFQAEPIIEPLQMMEVSKKRPGPVDTAEDVVLIVSLLAEIDRVV